MPYESSYLILNSKDRSDDSVSSSDFSIYMGQNLNCVGCDSLNTIAGMYSLNMSPVSIASCINFDAKVLSNVPFKFIPIFFFNINI